MYENFEITSIYIHVLVVLNNTNNEFTASIHKKY